MHLVSDQVRPVSRGIRHPAVGSELERRKVPDPCIHPRDRPAIRRNDERFKEVLRPTHDVVFIPVFPELDYPFDVSGEGSLPMTFRQRNRKIKGDVHLSSEGLALVR